MFKAFLAYARERSWPKEVLNEIDLILEEWVTNIVSHGLANHPDPWMSVRLEPEGDTLRIITEDNGPPFDPLKHPAADVSSPLEERPVGGLGIHMIRKLCSDISYRHHGGRNELHIAKSLSRPALQKSR